MEKSIMIKVSYLFQKFGSLSLSIFPLLSLISRMLCLNDGEFVSEVGDKELSNNKVLILLLSVPYKFLIFIRG
jgi:hypothetical protein